MILPNSPRLCLSAGVALVQKSLPGSANEECRINVMWGIMSDKFSIFVFIVQIQMLAFGLNIFYVYSMACDIEFNDRPKQWVEKIESEYPCVVPCGRKEFDATLCARFDTPNIQERWCSY